VLKQTSINGGLYRIWNLNKNIKPGIIIDLSSRLSRNKIFLPSMLKNFTPWCRVAYKRILYIAEKKHIPATNSNTPEGRDLVELIMKISLTKLIVKGPPKFDIINKNHMLDKDAKVDIFPLLTKELRE